MDLPVPELIRLDDGRLLSWYSFGDPDGVPVVYAPGTPESGLAGACYDDAARRAGVRWLSLDKPGYGRSDPHPRRRLLDWAHDVEQLADRLGLDRFAVAGESGGGPHALAAGRALADRIDVVLLLAGMGPADEPWVRRGMRPTNQLIVMLGRHAPMLMRAPIGLSAYLTRHEDRFPRLVARMDAAAPEPDRVAMADPEYAVRHQALADAFRQGIGPTVDELALFARPWGFDLADVTAPVHLWHGALDVNVPLAVGKAVAERLPHVTTHLDDTQAHAVGFVHRDEVMRVARESR